MTEQRELLAKELRFTCEESVLAFETTADIPPLEVMVGQERAVKAVEFGLCSKTPGYNIYISGLVGTGKMTYAKRAVAKVADSQPTPPDLCYVNNFDNPSQPIAMTLPAGLGSVFRQDVRTMIEDLKNHIPKVFSSDDYEQAKSAILKKFQDGRSVIMDEFGEQAEKIGILPQWTTTGFAGLPIRDGKPMSPEDFQLLDREQREELEKKMLVVHEKAMEAQRQVQVMERETREQLKSLDTKIGLFAVGHLIDELVHKYTEHEQVLNYLEAVKQDVVKNIGEFKPSSPDEDGNPLLFFRKSMQESVKDKYQINLVVDNKEVSGAPVVVEINPTYYNLIGRVEYEARMGVVNTDFSMIKAGAFHRANGGYLILNIKDVLMNIGAWEALKRILKTRMITIENLGEQYGMLAMASLKPQPIPLNVKVILVGNSHLYHVVFTYDEDFRKLFKVFADFDTVMDNNPTNIHKLAAFVASTVQRDQLKHFNRAAVGKVVEYATRLSDSKNKLTTQFTEIVELCCEADTWATMEGSSMVGEEHIKKALEEKRSRYNKYEERLQEMFAEGKLLVDTSAEKIGQVNGLAVLSVGEYSFGKPSRITANTFLGRSGIINIERETKMSGTSHSKGVLILSGYLGQQYAQKSPLTLTASLTFEQLYDGVDGDSASSTELYAILSSLAEAPIRQYIAVTGSVNQKGEIQPIGGANQKIEGFFAVCKLKGLTGTQGVMIPHQNVSNLTLNDEVVAAVEAGTFHIYPVTTIDEGIELLTGIPAGEPDENGHYPEGTIHFLVSCKLKEFTQILIDLGKSHEGEQSASKAD